MTPEIIDQIARTAGLALSPAELEALLPMVVRTLEMLEGLESLALASTEPATLYRIA